MWTLRKSPKGNYYESSLKLGKITLWLMAFDNRWAVEIGDNTLVIEGKSDSIQDAQQKVSQEIIKLLSDTALVHQASLERNKDIPAE